MNFDVLNLLYFLAIILLATKCMGMLTRKLGLPQVVGMVIAGLLIGPALFINSGTFFHGIINPTKEEMDVLKVFSEIGVVFILFSSGLETDFKELKKSGVASTAIALAGVLVPTALGTIVSLLFMGGFSKINDKDILLNALFVGIILAATSVGITVETLRELGKLNTKIGTTILSAAIIDDILGILVLSVVTSIKGDGNVWVTLIRAAGFLIFSVVVGYGIRTIFRRLEKKYPHKRRTGIFAVALCFIFAYIAEKDFGIAAITGAYIAGLALSGLRDTDFVDRKVLVNGYMIFTPIFFAYIGISADFSHFKIGDLLFGLIFVAVGIIGKILGCGLAAKPFKYTNRQSLTIGCGMIARGEVALAVYSAGYGLIHKGLDGKILGIDPLVATIMLIVISSILCPIFLKLVFKNQIHPQTESTVYKPMSDES